MSSCSSIVVMRLNSTTAIASTSHESIYADMHVALKLYPMHPMPMVFVVTRHDMSSFTQDLPQRALHSLTLASSQPTVQDRRRIGPLGHAHDLAARRQWQFRLRAILPLQKVIILAFPRCIVCIHRCPATTARHSPQPFIAPH